MSKKHERNLRYLARTQAYAHVATEALHQAGASISQMEVGPSASAAQAAYDRANHSMRELDSAIEGLAKLVCS